MRIRTLLLVVFALLGPAACDAGAAVPQASTPQSAVPSAKDVKPTFTDVRVGDTVSVVRVAAFKAGRNRSVVVEPVIYMKNPDFCRAFKIPLDDKQCSYPYAIEHSTAKITLPRADDATYALIDSDRWRECTDKDLVAAVCKVTAAQFQKWAAQGDGTVVMTTRNGTATGFAELYFPESYED
ncbi:hypothetical protein [Actinoplanes couchii]|uniref:Uncharacterized protein n=1 Tax=Actinoplanes couchii TaxID=403638 RepID=A0ABQ3XNU9_9ACTN|nr:hypothetical protein [Actinoplanes couchii]MDR6318585.1 hypothetical protein [Actinoplanes couchii]GID60194.1 hypothetical protein Aco03nite_085980 [Actinoplanes couchii]